MKVRYITPRWKIFFKDWGIDKEREWLPDQNPNNRLVKKVLRVMFNADTLVEIAKHHNQINQGMNPTKVSPILKEKVWEMVKIIEDEKWRMKKSYDEKIMKLYDELTKENKE